MKLKVFLSLPLRLPVLRAAAAIMQYCPYNGKDCWVNWINTPTDCSECYVRNPKDGDDHSEENK